MVVTSRKQFRCLLLTILVICLIPVSSLNESGTFIGMRDDTSLTFQQIWATTGAINDPYGDGKTLNVRDLIDIGTFRSAEIDDWDTNSPDVISLAAFNLDGYPIWETNFAYVGPASDLTSWFSDGQILFSTMSAIRRSTVTCHSQYGNQELVFEDGTDGGVLFFIFQEFGSSYFTFARSSSTATIDIHDMSSDSYNGCWPQDALHLSENSTTNTLAMTVELCYGKCDDSTFGNVCLMNGDTCFCCDFKDNGILPYEAGCTEVCVANSSQGCGSKNNGLYSVYGNFEQVTNMLLFQTTNGTVASKERTGTHSTVHIDFGTSDDDDTFVDRVHVDATPATGGGTGDFQMKFANKFTHNFTHSTWELIKDQFGDPVIFQANKTVSIEVMPIKRLIISFLDDVSYSNVSVYGPTGDYIVAPYITVSGYWEDETTSTTTAITTSPTTPTTSPISPSPVSSSISSDTSIICSSFIYVTVTVTETTYLTSFYNISQTENTPSLATSTALYASETELVISATSTAIGMTSQAAQPTAQPQQTTDPILAAQQVTQTSSSLTLEEKIDAIVQELTVDKTAVSSYTRTKTSADDTRPTAQTMGSFGIITIVAVVCIVVGADIPALTKAGHRFARNVKRIRRILEKRFGHQKTKSQSDTNSSAATPSTVESFSMSPDLEFEDISDIEIDNDIDTYNPPYLESPNS